MKIIKQKKQRMATLFNTKISQTYEGLLKTIDNAAISASLKELTDGSGNQSGLYLNTAGDFKVSAILEWGSLKDTGTGVTITRFVTSTDGLENFNNNTSLPTSAAVKLYVDTKFSQTDTLTEVLGFGNTTSGKDILVSAGDDITFTDSSKILMGAGSDLQIYHDGSNSYIIDAGTGGLTIQANADFALQSTGTNENFITAATNAFVKLYFNGNEKLATTNTGVDITGNLVVSGTITGSGGSFLPLAGGTMTGNIVLNDNVKSIYGTASDGLEIYHDSNNSYIKDSGTGTLNIQGSTQVLIGGSNGQIGVQYIEGVDVKLRHANSTKLATASTGVNITGALSTTTDVTVGANANFVDNGKAIFGAGSDLQIYHDGSNSYIAESGTGSLYVQGSNIIIQSSINKNAIICGDSDSVELYFNAAKKFETLTDGAKVTGNLEVTGTITGAGGSFLPLIGGTMTGNTIHNDNVKSVYGTSSDGLQIYHNGSNSFISDTGTGLLVLSTNTLQVYNAAVSEFMITATENGSVDLYYDNSKKFETTSTGISVTGNGAFTGSVQIPNAGQLQLGTGLHMLLQHNSANGFIKNLTGQLNIDQAAVTQSIVFRVSNANALDTTALTINREGDLTTGADVTIAGNLTVNGTTTTINTQTLAVEDPLIELSKDNTANSVDIGMYGKYNDGTARYLGLFSDASDSNKFKLFKGLTVQPTSTVNIGGAGYVAADLVVAGLEATSFTNSGNLVVEGTSNLKGFVTLGDASGDEIPLTWNSSSQNFSMGANGSNFMLGTSSDLDTGNLFQISSSGNATFTGDVSLLDNKKLKIGTGSDIQIYHNSSNDRGYIYNGTGDLYIENDATDGDIRFFSDNGSGGTVEYFRLDGGISSLMVNKDILMYNDGANGKLKFGASQDLQIYHDGSHSYIEDTGTGDLRIKSNGTSIAMLGNANEDMVLAIPNGAVNLYYNNSKKFETTNTGIKVTGEIRTTDYIVHAGDSDTYFGFPTDNEFKLVVGGNNIIAGDINAAYLYHQGSAKLQTTSTGIAVSGTASTFAGNVGIGSFPTSKLQLEQSIVPRITMIKTGVLSWYVGNPTQGSSGNFTIGTDSGSNLDILTLDTSGNSTFAGDVTANGIYSAGQSAIIYKAQRNGGAVAGDWSYDDATTDMSLGTSTSHSFSLKTGNTRALTIDTSQNSTFAGKVVVGKDSSNALEVFSSGDTEIGFSYATQGNIYAKIIGDITNASPLGGELAFQTSTGGTLAERMRIAKNGTLTVGGQTSTRLVTTITENDNVNIDSRDGTTTARKLSFSTGGAQRFILSSDGDVYNYQSGNKANTYYGYDAGNYDGTGGSNTVMGYAASPALTTGAQNVSIGRDASNDLTTGSSNVAIGMNAGAKNVDGQQNTYIGTEAGYTSTGQNYNTFVGRAAGFYNVANESTGIGRNAMHSNTSGVRNTSLGFNSLFANQTGDGNVAVGYKALQDATGDESTAIGDRALAQLTTGVQNISIGTESGFSENTGSNQIFIGFRAGYNIKNTVTASGENVIIGHQAALNRTGGTENVFIGSLANYIGVGTGSNNVVVGRYSGAKMTSANRCTFLGHQAGAEVTTGPNNTFIGKGAGDATTTGSNNTHVGQAAGDEATIGDYNICIGHGSGSGSSPFQLTTQSGRVVIGDNSITNAYIKVAFTVTSDSRDKTEFKNIPLGLDFVNKLKPTSYKFRKDRDTEETQGKEKYGFLAQDILKLEGDNPVIIDNENLDSLTYNESSLIPVLVNAIQELNEKVEMLEKRCQCKN